MAINLGDIEKKNKDKYKSFSGLSLSTEKRVVNNNQPPQTIEEAKKVYETRKRAKKIAEEDIINTFEKKNIAFDGNALNPQVSLQSYYSKEMENPKNKYMPTDSNYYDPRKKMINQMSKAIENVKQFEEFNKSEEIKSKKKKLIDEYNKTAEAYSNYQQKKLEKDDIGWYDKSIGRIVDGVLSPFSMFGSEQAINENGDIYYVPSYNDLKNQKVIESYDDSLLGKAGKIASSALYEGGKIVTSAALNKAVPGLGSSTYFSDLYSKQLNNAVAEGYDSSKATLYATIGTATEVATGKILGGTTKAVFGGTSSEMSQIISKNLSKVISNHPNLVNAVSNAISEGSEEFVQEYLDRLNRNLVLGENEKVFSKETFDNAVYSALVGSLTGAATGSFDGTNYSDLEINGNNAIKNEVTLPKNNTVQESVLNSALNNKISENNLNDLSNPILPKVNNEVILPKINNQENVISNNNRQSIFSKQIDEVLNGTYPKRDMLIVSQNTPKILQDLGLNDLPITMTQKHLYTITNSDGKYQNVNYHNIPIETIKQIPYALEHPLNVLKSDTKPNSIVVVTELSDSNNDIVVASIAIDGKGQINDIQIDSNVMTSAYGKSENYDYYMKDNISRGNLLYDIDDGIINKINNNTQKKSDATDRFQLPMRDSSSSTTTSDIPKDTSPIDTNNISQSNNIVKSDISSIYNMQNNQDNVKIPLAKNINKFSEPEIPVNSNTKNISNPLEISNLTQNDANTTPTLPKINRNDYNDGNSRFASNIENKTNMLNDLQKKAILSSEEVKYYDKVTNKESLDKAFDRLNKNGQFETTRWINIASENADSVDVAEGFILLKQYADSGDYDMVVEVAKKLRDIGTKAGQTVQAFNIMARMTPEGMVKYAQSELLDAYNQMVKNKSKEWIDKYRADFDLKPEEVKFIMDTMKEVSTMEDGYEKKVKLAEIQKLMTDKLPPQKGTKIKSWMRISMLFNPKTQVRNVAGNALIAPVNHFSDLFSSYADKLVSKATGVRTTGKTNIKAVLKGMKEGAYQATNDYRKGINTKDMEGNRFEIGEGKSFSDKNLIGRNLNRVEGLLNYVMDAGDRIFSQASFENSLQNQLVLNNTTEITQEMIDIARTESLQRTWNDNNNYTKFVLDVRRLLNKIGTKNYGLGDVLIPFAKTPANLTKAIVDYSPAGLVNTIIQGNNLRKSLNNGQYTPQMQHKFVQSLGKATAGTILYIAGLALAKAGITSGESDDDKDTANFLKNTLGVSSYSIKIGNKSFAYDWAQPIAAPLAITANIVDKQKENDSLMEIITSSLDEGFNVVLEQSFFQSINDVFSDPGKVPEKIGQEILELPARAIPTFSKQVADLVDSTQRTAYEYGKPIQTAINNMKIKIPFLSKTLAPSVDTLGREIKKYGGKNNLFNIFLNPANVNTENISDAAEEIYRVYKETGDKTIMPRVAPYYINKNNEKIILTSEKKSEYQKVSGSIIEDNVNKLIRNSDYKNLNDSEKSEIIKSIVDYSYNKARKGVLNIDMSNEYNKINKYISLGGNASNYYLYKDEINYSIQNPNKYSVITQITTYDKYNKYKKEIDTLRENNVNRKNDTINYINSLKLNIAQKAMFIKLYYSSFDEYNSQIIQHINSQRLSAKEKETILNQLGFTIRNGKVYS